MKTKLLTFVFALLLTAITGSAQIGLNPIDTYITAETDRIELEEDLFGFQLNDDEIVSVLSIDLFELEEEIELDFDTKEYLPANFDPYKGMNRLNWDNIPLYEVEEEIDLDFTTDSSEAGIGRGR